MQNDGKNFCISAIYVTNDVFSKCFSELLRRMPASIIESSKCCDADQESVMLFNEIRRLVTWLVQSPVRAADGQFEARAETTDSSIFSFDPASVVWHGDHWQNLLSSPMDARRYVMEDWSVSATAQWNPTEGAAPAY